MFDADHAMRGTVGRLVGLSRVRAAASMITELATSRPTMRIRFGKRSAMAPPIGVNAISGRLTRPARARTRQRSL
jgi:hypothetical protein